MDHHKSPSPPSPWMYITLTILFLVIITMLAITDFKVLIFLLICASVIWSAVSHYKNTKAGYEENDEEHTNENSKEETPPPNPMLFEFPAEDIDTYHGRILHKGDWDGYSFFNGNLVIKLGNALYLKGRDVDHKIYPDGKKIFDSTSPGKFKFSINDEGVVVTSETQIIFIPYESYY